MRNNYLLRKYGITSEQYDDLLRRQQGCCAIGRRPATHFKTKLCVDHDHHTKEIRGLLCTFCNRRVIGRHRDAGISKRAYEYLCVGTGWLVPPKRKRKKHGSRLEKNNARKRQRRKTNRNV